MVTFVLIICVAMMAFAEDELNISSTSNIDSFLINELLRNSNQQKHQEMGKLSGIISKNRDKERMKESQKKLLSLDIVRTSSFNLKEHIEKRSQDNNNHCELKSARR
ncbi:CLUMA_CG017524, isoform A [Clunio marinus]|uniref:CLUMA_CG017524, isoform A n=1 Tax=Clunio marinus TaxID=568069 RepID=A0A1J1IW94_9DIPT|nr:CLUMA_CG017524, isoform A [Clunio marinus]